MTVQTNTNVANFLGNGAATYPIGFKFNSAADLVVQKTVIATGVTTTLTLNSDYSVAGAGVEEGGSITFSQAPTSAESIKVTRVVDLLQLTDLRNQGKFYAEVHEAVFDKLAMIDQQQQTEIDDANAKSDEAVATANAANAKSDHAVAKADQNLVDMQAQYDAFEQGAALVVIGDYAPGLVVDGYNKIFRKDGEFYRADASLNLPYTLAGDWLAESAKFVSVGDAVLRQELAADGGAGLIGWLGGVGGVVRTVRDRLLELIVRSDYSSDAAFNTAKTGKLSRDASGRLRTHSFIAGTEELSGAAARDAFVAGRNVTGSTDCHGFADRTVMSGVTDAGTYGAFDCTVKLEGANTQNHIYSFQDRATYNGDGVLQHQAGFMSVPVHAGSGTIDMRTGVDIRDVSKSGTGAISANIGVYVRDLLAGGNNVGINVLQSTGYAFFAGGGAPSYLKGQLRVGGQTDVGALISAQRASGPSVFMTPSATAAYMGATGDYALQLYNNAAIRLEIMPSTGSYAVRPGADNTQPLGDLSRRWSQLYAGTGTISTSDAREKTGVRSLNAAEIAAAKALAKEIGAFQFLASVAAKGDAAREHIGMTVQRAIEVMESHGLNPFSYSFICYDEWSARPEIRNPETDQVEQEAEPGGNRYSFRFEGLLAFIAAGLEARLSALEAAL